MFTSEKMVKFLREKYPPGTRIRLVSMEDPYAPVAPGTEGRDVLLFHREE